MKKQTTQLYTVDVAWDNSKLWKGPTLRIKGNYFKQLDIQNSSIYIMKKRLHRKGRLQDEYFDY